MNISSIITRIWFKLVQFSKILHLKLRRNHIGLIAPLEGINDSLRDKEKKDFTIKIFEQEVDYKTINWHEDYKSGYVYPRKLFNTIKYPRLYNQGIEVKFPWELSRFQYGVDLALCYHNSKDEKYYNIFKTLIFDWIRNNHFLIGINWVCTMDVAIRAVNWVITANMFGDIFWRDKNFVSVISKKLADHAFYIETFPEIKKEGKNNNHLISDYSGLFILSLALRNHSRADKWLKIAKKGLENCMQEQVLEDGTDFENSIPYHRLVVELFAIPLILKEADFSDTYKERLFKMFEFVRAYIDQYGNAPQIGDNDSGVFIKLSEKEEQNHSYLLSLGKSIFGYQFQWNEYTGYIPVLKSLDNKLYFDKVRNCEKSISFDRSGYYFLKNENITVSIFCPVTTTGHRHFDSGSFTLSYKGNPIIVDPGSGCYTSNLEIRKALRDYTSHNLYYLNHDNSNNSGYFGIKIKTFVKVDEFTNNSLAFSVILDNGTKIKRYFKLLSDKLVIEDEIDGSFHNLLYALHFYHTAVVIVEGAKNISEEEYKYSPMYSVIEKKKKIIILPGPKLTTSIICK